MLGQFLHCSQFYETLFGLSILLLVLTQLLAIKFELTQANTAAKMQEVEAYQKWMNHQSPASDTVETPAPVLDAIQREISEIQQKAEPEPQPQPQLQHQNQVQPQRESEPTGPVQIQLDQSVIESNPNNNTNTTQRPTEPIKKYRSSVTSQRQSVPQQPSEQARISTVLYKEINQVFDSHVPVVMCVIVVGILVYDTEVFSLAMFFCYLFSTCLFNYIKIQEKLQQQYSSPRMNIVLGLLNGVFMGAIFISYFIKIQYLS